MANKGSAWVGGALRKTNMHRISENSPARHPNPSSNTHRLSIVFKLISKAMLLARRFALNLMQPFLWWLHKFMEMVGPIASFAEEYGIL